MGYGLIIILAALILIGRGLRWHNIFMTLLNPARARFTRRDGPDGATVFEVTPARASWVALAVLLTGLLLMWSAVLGTGALVFAFSLLPLIMGLLALAVGARYRRAVRLTVANGTLGDGTRSWKLAEIAQLAVRKGSRRGEEDVGSTITTIAGTGAVYGGKPTTSLLMKALGGRMAERSFLLLLRTRAGSSEEVLSGGLTPECAQALRDDLGQALREHG